jgi:hypothetical protein
LNDINKPVICIVGSGIGGGILALELLKSNNFKVKILDNDALNGSFSQDSQLASINVGHPFLVPPNPTRGFGFGGTSNLWHGVLTVLDEVDWTLMESKFGLILKSEIKKFYLRLGVYFGNVPITPAINIHDKVRGNKLFSPLLDKSIFRIKDFYLQPKPLRIRSRLNSCAKTSSSLEIIENSTALYLFGKNEDPASASYLLAEKGGEKIKVYADYFVLAAGALETPRIILQGNLESNFKIQNKLVGRRLFDHPWCVIGELISRSGFFKLKFSDVFFKKNLKYRVGLRISTFEKGFGNLNHCVGIKPLFFGDYELFKGALKALISRRPSLRSMVKLFKTYRFRDILFSALILLAEKSNFGVFVKKALVFCYLEQQIRPESNIDLSGHYDSHGRNIPLINWVVGKREVNDVIKIQGCISDALHGSENFVFSSYKIDELSLGSSSHHAGTMSIGVNDKNGVVDDNLKLFGSTNVYVCDLSIFPNYGNSNPSFTLGAFALRLADHLNYQFSKKMNF